jgi:transglutaminase-like putative cysteine protease
VWDSAGGSFVAATTDTIRAWRIEHDAPGAPTTSWVDAGGVLVHQEIGGGITLHRSACEIGRNNYRELRRSEPQIWRRTIPGMRSLASSGRIPETSASARAFVVTSDSGSPAWRGTRALEGGRQRAHGDTVVISRSAPADSGPAPALLGSTWDIPVEDDGVRAAATAALAGATSAEDSIRRLTRWVARQIGTDTGATASATALFTLRARRGGPEGKARLLAAMGRASGIPSRVVSGLALLPDGSYGHAWTELWAGHWIAADPTFGHVPASASLLRLAVGGGSRPIDLVLLAGSARFLPIRAPR